MRIKRSIVALITCIATLVAGLLVLNFSPGEKKIDTQLTRLYDTGDPQFRRSLGVLLGPPIIEGNKAEVLLNGDRIFPAMLDAIRSARQSISFETYIYWEGTIGREFTEALSERARAGVKVHVLLDWIGSMKIGEASLDEMRRAGVQVHRYHKPVWWKLARLNNRTHRKLLIVDGKVGFTGGVGIADKWRGNAQDPDHWRDSHFRVEGPVVGQMQAVFNDNWTKATGTVLDGADYFPALQHVGDMPAQMFSSSPTGGAESMHLMYLMAITSARKTIDLSAAYFVPDELTVTALRDAMKRGVRVRLVVPGPHVDSKVVRNASQTQWGAMLQAGARMYRYQPALFHNKLMIVDGYLTIGGSANFDNRSFQLNDESNINIYDRAFAAHMTEVIDNDIARSRELTLAQWRQRPWRQRVFDWLSSQAAEQL